MAEASPSSAAAMKTPSHNCPSHCRLCRSSNSTRPSRPMRAISGGPSGPRAKGDAALSREKASETLASTCRVFFSNGSLVFFLSFTLSIHSLSRLCRLSSLPASAMRDRKKPPSSSFLHDSAFSVSFCRGSRRAGFSCKGAIAPTNSSRLGDDKRLVVTVGAVAAALGPRCALFPAASRPPFGRDFCTRDRCWS